MKKVKNFIFFCMAIFFSNWSLAGSQDTCPAPPWRWIDYPIVQMGNMTWETSYETPQELLTHVAERMRNANPDIEYVFADDDQIQYGIFNYTYKYRDRTGTSQFMGISQPICPHGFKWGPNGNDYGNRCVNIETQSCQCPQGKRFKNSVAQCVEAVDLPPDADPERDKGPDCPTGDGEPTQPQCGNPINPNNGNKIQVETDFELPGVANWLTMRRIYNGQVNTVGNPAGPYMFGAVWSSPFDVHAVSSSSPMVTQCFTWLDDNSKECTSTASPIGNGFTRITLPNGKINSFSNVLKNNNWTFDPTYSDMKDQISLMGSYDENYSFSMLAARDYTSYRFSTDFGLTLLTSIKERSGRKLVMTYLDSGSNDSSVHRLSSKSPICTHVQPGAIIYPVRLGCITDDWGRQINFEYESVPIDRNEKIGARVTKVIDPNGKEYQYGYDGISGGCLPDKESAACFANNLTSVAYPDGGVRIYHYNERSHINGGAICPGPAAVGNGFGNLLNTLTGVTDENGKRFADWTYDCSGRATSSQHAGGAERVEVAYGDADEKGIKKSTIKTYSGLSSNPLVANNTLTAQIINGRSLNIASDGACPGCGKAAQRSFDANGNTSSYTDRNGVITKFQFDLDRNLELVRTEAVNTPQQRTITTSWHSQYPLPLQKAYPLRISTFTYDNSGNLLSRTDQATTDKNGALGLGAKAADAARVWRYTYNNLGQMLSATGPRTDISDRTIFAYDALGNLSTSTNALGQVTAYSGYDLNGRIGQIQEPSGRLTTFAYTSRGKVADAIVSYGDLVERTSYVYDRVGQLVKINLPNDTVNRFIYDDAHRLTRVEDNSGNSINYTYDIQGNIIGEQVKDSSNELTRQVARVFDTMNRVIQVTGAAQ